MTLLGYATCDNGLSEHPQIQELYDDLEVGVLDYADERIREFIGRHGKLARAMADPDWKTWEAIPVTRRDIRPGFRVRIVGTSRWSTVDHVEPGWLDGDEPLIFTRNEWGRPEELPRREPFERWVPIPVDGATLGEDLPKSWDPR